MIKICHCKAGIYTLVTAYIISVLHLKQHLCMTITLDYYCYILGTDKMYTYMHTLTRIWWVVRTCTYEQTDCITIKLWLECATKHWIEHNSWQYHWLSMSNDSNYTIWVIMHRNDLNRHMNRVLWLVIMKIYNTLQKVT